MNTFSNSSTLSARIVDSIPFFGADDLLANAEMAELYVLRRQKDASNFLDALKWKEVWHDGKLCREVRGIYNDITIIQYPDAASSPESPWGKLQRYDDGIILVDEKVCETIEQFVAYMLAKYW
jgi:hypothetical protein